MAYDHHVYHRQSIRLREYDYSQPGYYYVTICTWGKENLFGTIQNGVMVLNEFGEIIKNEWIKTPQIRTDIELDEFIVMPNHFHGILIITGKCRGVLQYAPTYRFRSPFQNIGSIIRGFKSTTTKQINILRNAPQAPVWQRNYYERVIRNDIELHKIREYITANPAIWDSDEENPCKIRDCVVKFIA